MQPMIADVPDRVAARWMPAPGAAGFLPPDATDTEPEPLACPRPEPEIALVESLPAGPPAAASIETPDTIHVAASAALLCAPVVAAVEMGEALPLLALLASLPPEPTPATLDAGTVDAETVAPAIPLHVSACTMDELWLGDFEMEDPRRQSLGDRIGGLVGALWRAMFRRLGFGRPARIGFSIDAMSNAAV
jgi:cell division protein FtsZ